MTRNDIIRQMEFAMIALGHNSPWWNRAEVALDAIRQQGAAVVDKHELEILQNCYGFSLQDFTEPEGK